MKYVKRGYAEYKKPTSRARHHAYTGLVIMVAGFVILFWQWYWLSALGVSLGLWLFIDDYYQHYIQLKQWERFGYYDKYTLWNWLPNTILFGETYT